MTAKILLFCNYKGGVGKTTTSCMAAFQFAKMGLRTLLIDLDAQGNSTDLMTTTHDLYNRRKLNIERRLVYGDYYSDMKSCIYNIVPNLDLIGNGIDGARYGEELLLKYRRDEIAKAEHFKKLVEPLREDYDIIILDIPPTISTISDIAVYVSDFAVLVVQTQAHSLQGAQRMLTYLDEITTKLETGITILGVLPVIFKTNSINDSEVLNAVTRIFGEENVLNDHVTQGERLKRYMLTGITDNKHDAHDKRVHAKYFSIANDILERMEGV